MYVRCLRMHSVFHRLYFNFVPDSLTPMTLNDRNIEMGQRWRSLGESRRNEFVHRARTDRILFDGETRADRQLNKIIKNVCSKFNRPFAGQ